MLPSPKAKQVPVLGKYLEEAKEAFLSHLQVLGLFERINPMATSTAPIVTYPVSKLLVHDMPKIQEVDNLYIPEIIDVLWDLFDIVSRIGRSSNIELRDLRARILRIELAYDFMLKNSKNHPIR